jgi:hypothetical protein
MTTPSGGPLRAAQIGEFVEQGFTVLRPAFSRSTAEAVRQALGRRIRVDHDDPARWTEPRVWLKEALTEPPYTDALTDRFVAAVDQLVGPDRWPGCSGRPSPTGSLPPPSRRRWTGTSPRGGGTSWRQPPKRETWCSPTRCCSTPPAPTTAPDHGSCPNLATT